MGCRLARLPRPPRKHRGADARSQRDPLTIVPVAVAPLATLIRPATWRHFTSGSVQAYALTPAAWHYITQYAAAAADAGQT